MSKNLQKSAIFYDGNFFFHISNYYNYVHDKRSRLSLKGLHDFVSHFVADVMDTDMNLCPVVESHYFRGRLNAREASQRGNQLFYDRVFDDVLMAEGVVTHYIPMRSTGYRNGDKSLDMVMALEVYELTIRKQFDFVILIASDSNFVPLVRKLSALGTKIVVLGWDFEYNDADGRRMVTRTSHDLMEEATYPIAMAELIDERLEDDQIIKNIFVRNDSTEYEDFEPIVTDDNLIRSTVLTMKDGYGFIKYPPNNLFFFYGDVDGSDFNDLYEGDIVEFTLGLNDAEEQVAKNVKRVLKDSTPSPSTEVIALDSEEEEVLDN